MQSEGNERETNRARSRDATAVKGETGKEEPNRHVFIHNRATVTMRLEKVGAPQNARAKHCTDREGEGVWVKWGKGI